jgi:hypothetical protein
VRRGVAILVSLAALLLPASALATTVVWVGDVAGDTSPDNSFTFQAKGKVSKKGRFIASRVRDFEAAVTFSCFDAAGAVVSSERRDDLAPGFFGGLSVRHQMFFGMAPTSTGLAYTVSGHLGRRKADGALSITQGQRGAAGYCSTGSFQDPIVTWNAKLIPPVCGKSAERRLCATPRP